MSTGLFCVCGAEARLEESRHWTGQSSVVVAVRLSCVAPVNSQGISHNLTVRARTQEEAEAEWRRLTEKGSAHLRSESVEMFIDSLPLGALTGKEHTLIVSNVKNFARFLRERLWPHMDTT